MSTLPISIIGERINPGFKSSLALLEAEDLDGLQALAEKQVAAGAALLNINVGPRCERDPRWMVRVVQAVQEAVAVPLSFDSPQAAAQAACLQAYDAERAGGLPVVNSVTEHRWEMLDLLEIAPFRMLFMVSERVDDGKVVANRRADEIHRTAKRMAERARLRGWSLDDIIVDVSIGPMASDMDGITTRALEAIGLIGGDPDLRGIHMSVGLSNLSIMLPKVATDGQPLGLRLENAFLSAAVPAGLDMVLGTPWRAYDWLPEDDFVRQGFARFCSAEDACDALEELQDLYAA